MGPDQALVQFQQHQGVSMLTRIKNRVLSQKQHLKKSLALIALAALFPLFQNISAGDPDLSTLSFLGSSANNPIDLVGNNIVVQDFSTPSNYTFLTAEPDAITNGVPPEIANAKPLTVKVTIQNPDYPSYSFKVYYSQKDNNFSRLIESYKSLPINDIYFLEEIWIMPFESVSGNGAGADVTAGGTS